MRGTRVDGSEEQFQNTFVLFNSFVDQIEKKMKCFWEIINKNIPYLKDIMVKF